MFCSFHQYKVITQPISQKLVGWLAAWWFTFLGGSKQDRIEPSHLFPWWLIHLWSGCKDLPTCQRGFLQKWPGELPCQHMPTTFWGEVVRHHYNSDPSLPYTKVVRVLILWGVSSCLVQVSVCMHVKNVQLQTISKIFQWSIWMERIWNVTDVKSMYIYI